MKRASAKRVKENNEAIQAAAKEIAAKAGPANAPKDAGALKVAPIKEFSAAEVVKAVRGAVTGRRKDRARLELLHVEDGAMVATDGSALVTCSRPRGIANGDYPLTTRGESFLKSNGGRSGYPQWRQVVPKVAGAYSKAGEIENGGRGMAVVKLASIRIYSEGDAYFTIGNVIVDPGYFFALVSSMFKLGAERVKVNTAGFKSPIVLKGNSAKCGEVTGVLMPMALAGDEKTHVETLGKHKSIRMEFDAPAAKQEKPAKVEEKPAPAAPAVEPSPYADHLTEWRKLTHDNEHTEVRLAISKWCEANAKSERDEFASIADDFAYILNTTGGDTMTPELCDFRMDLTDELMQRIGRVFGKETHAAIMGTL